MEKITINADIILELSNAQDWINKVPNLLPAKTRSNEKFLFIDKYGNVFEGGVDFYAAERIKSYPCKVYKLQSVGVAELRQDLGLASTEEIYESGKVTTSPLDKLHIDYDL